MERPIGADVFDWPEFAAFAARLGINLDLPTSLLVIRLPVDEAVRVTHEFDGRDLPASV